MELDLSTITKIFGAIDVQGFMIGRQFQVRELALKTINEDPEVFMVKPSISYHQLSNECKRMIVHQSSNLHNLAYEHGQFDLKQNEVITKIRDWILTNKEKHRQYVAVLNGQLARMLSEAGIEYIDLTIRGQHYFPTSKCLFRYGRQAFFRSTLPHCDNHIKEPDFTNVRRCAKEKVIYMLHWLVHNTGGIIFNIKEKQDDFSCSLDDNVFTDEV